MLHNAVFFLEVTVERRKEHNELWRLVERGYPGSVISLIKKDFATDSALINEVAEWYVERAEWVTFHDYEYLLNACALEPLGLSPQIRERLLAGFVKCGFHNHAERLAAGLGRLLTVDEVLSLVSHYTNGATQSVRIENDLRALAWKIGGELLEGRVRRDIAAMHARSDWKHLLK